MTSFALMFNWIGALPDKKQLLKVPGLQWHEYGKEARPGRKIGHATVIATDQAELLQRSEQIAAILGRNWAGLLTPILHQYDAL
jgi:5-(carboxyamino)imidazole ribonucleotide synthase